MDSSALPTMTIANYLRLVTRRRNLFLLVFAPLFFTLAAITVALPDLYRSTAEIQLDQPTSRRDDGLEIKFMGRHVDMLERRVFADGAISEIVGQHGLFPDETPSDARREFKDGLVLEILTSAVRDLRTGQELSLETGFIVGFEHEDPNVAKAVADDLMERFLVENDSFGTEETSKRTNFLSVEADKVRNEIVDLERMVADFKETNPTTLPELVNMNMNLMENTERQLTSIQNQIDLAESEKVILESRLAQIQATAADEVSQLVALQQEYREKSAVYGDGHPDIIRLRKELESLNVSPNEILGGGAEVLEQKNEELRRLKGRGYSDDHPDVRKLLRSIWVLEQQVSSSRAVRNEVKNIADARDPAVIEARGRVESMISRIRSLQGQKRQLASKLGDYEERLTRTPQVEREYQVLLRDLAAARQTYEQIMNRQTQAEFTQAIESGGQGMEFTVVYRPGVPPLPGWPNRPAILALGFAFILALGVGIVILVEALDNTVRDVSDVQRIFGPVSIAAVPVIRNNHDFAVQRWYVAGSMGLGATGLVVLAILAI